MSQHPRLLGSIPTVANVLKRHANVSFAAAIVDPAVLCT